MLGCREWDRDGDPKDFSSRGQPEPGSAAYQVLVGKAAGQCEAPWHLQGQTHSMGWRAWEVQRGDLGEVAREAAWRPGTPWPTPAWFSGEGEDGTRLHVYRLTQADPWKTELRKVPKRSHRQGDQ